MQIWQLFIVLSQPVDISVTVLSNLTKLTNELCIAAEQSDRAGVDLLTLLYEKGIKQNQNKYKNRNKAKQGFSKI